jgi:hypothetical protein
MSTIYSLLNSRLMTTRSATDKSNSSRNELLDRCRPVRNSRNFSIGKPRTQLDKIRSVVSRFRSPRCCLMMGKETLSESHQIVLKEIDNCTSRVDGKDGLRLYQLKAMRDSLETLLYPQHVAQPQNLCEVVFTRDKYLMGGWELINGVHHGRMVDFVETNRCDEHYIWEVKEGEIDVSGTMVEFLINPHALECKMIDTIHNIILAIFDKRSEDWFIGRLNKVDVRNIYPWERDGRKVVIVPISQMGRYHRIIPEAPKLFYL